MSVCLCFYLANILALHSDMSPRAIWIISSQKEIQVYFSVFFMSICVNIISPSFLGNLESLFSSVQTPSPLYQDFK